MSNPFVAEIRIVGFNFAPVGWAFCDGQLLPINQNTALFSLLGTTFGGNGVSNFALPNLQGSAPLQAGHGSGLSLRDLGQTGGEQTVTLTEAQMPSHDHTAQGATGGGESSPVGNAWGEGHIGKQATDVYGPSDANDVSMSTSALSNTGGNGPHNNMPPYLCLNFIISLQGVFPPRS